MTCYSYSFWVGTQIEIEEKRMSSQVIENLTTSLTTALLYILLKLCYFDDLPRRSRCKMRSFPATKKETFLPLKL